MSDGSPTHMNMRRKLAAFGLCAALAAGPRLIPASQAMPSSEPQTPGATGETAPAKRIGAVKAVAGNVITLTPDSGPEIEVTVPTATHIVRIAPGEKTLKNATPVQLQDLQPGDRILVAGKASDDAKAITAGSIVVMKRSDVEAHKEENLQD